MSQKNELIKLTEDLTKQITEQYFEENKEKHLADITGRVQFSLRELMMQRGLEVVITITHRNEK